MSKFVDIETPYSADTPEGLRRNLLYARACVRDSLMRGEVPFASHLFYTQPGILDDNVAEERNMGMDIGKKLIESLPGVATVLYIDLGVSAGMKFGVVRAKESNREIKYRTLKKGWEERELEIAKRHSHAFLWGM